MRLRLRKILLITVMASLAVHTLVAVEPLPAFAGAYLADASAIEHPATTVPPSAEFAEKFGLKSEFQELSALRSTAEGSDKDAALFLKSESAFLKRLWLVEFQIGRLLAQIDEERSVLIDAIEKINDRKALRLAVTDSTNFISSSIIALIGNGVFIPAPPPRPTAPNILFTVSGGLSTGLSILGLMELRGGKERITLSFPSLVAPLFDEAYSPKFSAHFWHYLNSATDKDEETIRQAFVRRWFTVSRLGTANVPAKSKGTYEALFAQNPGRPLTLYELQIRLAMLDDFQFYLLRANHDLSALVHQL
jgi:hypothetical protein